MKRNNFGLLCVLVVATLLPALVSAEAPSSLSAGKLQLAVDRLGVVGSALYLAAHPDDENQAILAWLANDRLVQSGYLSLTRGDGGQNRIGTEKGPELGMLRTQELLAARGVDGAEQLFSRAVDFGYTKSSEETLRFWGHEDVLGDIVWVYRLFRPDVVITRFPGTGLGGHGQHTASAQLALEAFQAAGDPSRFPEQLDRVEPWHPTRLVWNAWRPDLENRDPSLPPLMSVELGRWNPLLGATYLELAAAGRTMHKSQGFGASPRRGTYLNYFEHQAGDPAEHDLFDGIDLSWSRVPGGESIAPLISRIQEAYRPEDPAALLPLLADLHRELGRLPESHWAARKQAEVRRLMGAAAGLWLDATTEVPDAPPGSRVLVRFEAIAQVPGVTLESLELGDVAVASSRQELVVGQPFEAELEVLIPTESEPTRPQWLRQRPSPGAYRVKDPLVVQEPEGPAALVAVFSLALAGENVSWRVPVVHRWTHLVDGARHTPFVVSPPVTSVVTEPVVLFPDPSARSLSVVLRAHRDEVNGKVRVVLPRGWTADSPERSFELAARGDELKVEFSVNPPAETSVEELVVEVETKEGVFSSSEVLIDYPHVPQRVDFPEARVRLVRVDVARRGQRVAYVMGAGDEVPGVLRQLGYQVELLSDESLSGVDLSGYDVVVTGIRAFNTRDRLGALRGQLFDFAAQGGTVVVQYNTAHELSTEELGPYPLKLSRGRVSVEGAPVEILAPDHPLLSQPNRITEADFEGWVQERGLYFPGEWAPEYQTVVASHDPGEDPLAGGILYTPWGDGAYVYTSLSWFRQLPAGVPGAIRLFVNLLSAGGEG